jgi:dihydropyrimidinase
LADSETAKVIDAEGGYVTPGGIDGHVHLEQVTFNGAVGDKFKPGTRSGICGGTTSIVCFVLQEKTETDVLRAVEEYHQKVSSAATLYPFH